MASFVALPVDDGLQTRPAPERLYLFDGALLTQEHFRAEQLYFRGQLARLALHLHGAGTIAGLDVRYEPASGAGAEVRVAPGIALDRLGRLIELRQESCLTLATWLRQQNDDSATAAEVQAGLRDPAGPLPQHLVADVYLGFHACARTPEPAFATGNADTIDGVQASRILDGGHLELVIRPQGDDREPASLAASQLAAPVTAETLRAYKRTGAWALTQPEDTPFRMPAGGTISEHIIAGDRQDGSEILLARLILPVVTAAGQPVLFDETIDLAQPDFAPNQDIRPYSYSAEELALLAADLRR